MATTTETYSVTFDRDARTVRAEGPGLYVPLRGGGSLLAGETFDVRPVLQARETYVNEDKGAQFGETEWQNVEDDEYDRADIGPIYAALRREYGGKVSRMYRYAADGTVSHIGWTFSKRMEYEDSSYRHSAFGEPRGFYTRCVWVELRVAWLADTAFSPVIAIDHPNLKGKP